ncbi:hypothetical protein AYM40_26660 [Paraburkholderia phytofirmans OLGA172]|uniref:AB hydrolase-1 domain-containing protein n=1 Tax=Paraburkholderia phytofirmans OLGA172 TaxID=1417228 RepID=A0A160FSZ0_9BURK|nr:alpha/beta hydrolase [Paraburkholderia phytofirmans]ANB75886.1 hypothetical protein AYM40_26660 [Paraburkholderia phytofirmans OLGA172]
MVSAIGQETAETHYVDADGVRYAYRRLGPKGGIPLVFCHRFRGTMDDWDPAVVNGFAREREVILFDNAGVGNSTGTIPASIGAMAAHVVRFIGALGLKEVDLLGFSMGGHIGQAVILGWPHLIRRLILAGTYPGGGDGIILAGPEVRPVAGRPVLGLEEYLFLFFSPSEESQKAGRAYWERLKTRKEPIEPPVSAEGVQAQAAALAGWAQGIDAALPRLAEIRQPVLVANGHNDIMVPTINSFTMAQKIKRAQLIIYPDSGHGFLFQYPQLFVNHALEFLR